MREKSVPSKKFFNFINQDSAVSISVVVILIALAVYLTRTNTESSINDQNQEKEIIVLKEKQANIIINQGIINAKLDLFVNRMDRLTAYINNLANANQLKVPTSPMSLDKDND